MCSLDPPSSAFFDAASAFWLLLLASVAACRASSLQAFAVISLPQSWQQPPTIGPPHSGQATTVENTLPPESPSSLRVAVERTARFLFSVQVSQGSAAVQYATTPALLTPQPSLTEQAPT